MAYGVRHHAAKLDEDKVRAIRATYAEERTKGRTKANVITVLAGQYGVSVNTILYVVDRHTWRKVK
jgi:hypothetical protein